MQPTGDFKLVYLVENLGKVDGLQRRLDTVEARLWQGGVDGAV